MENIKKLADIFRDYHLHPTGNILDVGCGTGILVPLLLKNEKEQLNIVEMDFSLKMLRHNKLKWIDRSPTPVLFLQADAHHLPFENESYHWIICFAVLPHLLDQQKALRECFRILSSRGNILILHLMGSMELNYFHSKLGDVITRDHLPPAAELAGTISQYGLNVSTVIDRKDLYLIHATKR
jgi:ubiquinone/menaquinone biosynthesis C-methylase UbiE